LGGRSRTPTERRGNRLVLRATIQECSALSPEQIAGSSPSERTSRRRRSPGRRACRRSRRRSARRLAACWRYSPWRRRGDRYRPAAASYPGRPSPGPEKVVEHDRGLQPRRHGKGDMSVPPVTADSELVCRVTALKLKRRLLVRAVAQHEGVVRKGLRNRDKLGQLNLITGLKVRGLHARPGMTMVQFKRLSFPVDAPGRLRLGKRRILRRFRSAPRKDGFGATCDGRRSCRN
jgi:hypothetical protein